MGAYGATEAPEERFRALAAEAMSHLAKAVQGPASMAEEELALAADCTTRASAFAGIARHEAAR